MKFQVALNVLPLVIIFIKTCTDSKGTKENTNDSLLEKTKINETVHLFHNKFEARYNISDFKSINLNKTKSNKGIHDISSSKQINNKPIKVVKTNSTKRKKNSKVKPKITNKTKNPRGKKKGKVFQDTREDIIQYKLIDNMMFKPLDSNNSVSIVFSDESEITQADIDQAIEGRDGSCIAIPAKRKKDIYKEFLRWAHVQEKSERRAKIEKEVKEIYKNKAMHSNIHQPSKYSNHTKIARAKNGFRTVSNNSDNKTFSEDFNISSEIGRFNQFGNKSIFNRKENLTKSTKKRQELNPTMKTAELKNIKQKKKSETKGFKEESVELQYDPDFLQKLQNSLKEQAEKNVNKKGRKKKLKKQKQRQTYQGNPTDISADDYSAQEVFMMNTQKEAMGRRFYQMFVNKTASDFWDNNTLETTKMLEFLIPLGEHLHKTIEEPPPNQGTHFVEDLKMYKFELEKFIALVKKDKAETRPDVVALLEEPYEHVSETKYSEDEVKIMFGWSEEEYERFKQLLEEIREMWFDLQLFHNCYQFVSESAESFYSESFNYTNEEINEIIKNNTWLPS